LETQVFRPINGTKMTQRNGLTW